MIKPFAICFFLFLVIELNAQSLDRISISSGGITGDEVSYTIGETFNFTLSDNDMMIESGNLGSESFKGPDGTFIEVIEPDKNISLFCFPNPTKDLIYFKIQKSKDTKLLVEINDLKGNLVYTKTYLKSSTMFCDVDKLTPGIYLISVYGDNNEKISSTKFIKN